MNENENDIQGHDEPGALRAIAGDNGVQRAAAGVVVALVVSATKYFLFGSKS